MSLATLTAGDNFSLALPPKETAALAVYKSAEPNPMQAPATRIGTNPDSAFSSIQRIRLSFEGENALKNTPFARNYVLKRRMYCSSGVTIAANTGDDVLNKIIQDYIAKEWETMGVNCSMLDAFGRVGDCWLPERGDSALRIYNDGTSIKLLEISADRIGELYWFQDGAIMEPSIKLANGNVILPTKGKNFQYSKGLYFDGPTVVAYKIYDRIGDTNYVNPQVYPASDIIFFKDDIMGGVRGVTLFANALLVINGKNQILKATIQTMQQQSKIAAIASNNSGSPSEYTYETRVGDGGQIEYAETFADGAVVKYQFNGDSYQVLKGEHPSDSFVKGMKYLDWESAGTVGFTGEFLFTPMDSGGAPSRFSFSIADREITRIRHEVHRPKIRRIAFLTIAKGIRDGVIPANNARVFDFSVNFGVLPTADAFRDSKGDINEDRAGLQSKNDITTASFGKSYHDVLHERGTEVIARHRELKRINDVMKAEGLEAEATMDELAMLSDQPLNQAKAEALEKKEQPKETAKFSAFMGDVTMDSLSPEMQAEVNRIAPGSRIRRFGMTAAELLSKADPHNLEAARQKLKYATCRGCAEEVHANGEKHLIMMNDRLVDGHHFLAKAEKGKVTKSIPVLDLIPPLSVVA